MKKTGSENWIIIAVSFVLFFLLSSPVLAAASGEWCETLGVSQMSSDHTAIIVCVLKSPDSSSDATCDKSGGCVWAAMSNIVSTNDIKFGGLYETSNSGCVAATHVNPYTNQYSCPSGFKDQVVYAVTAASVCNSAWDQMYLHICTSR